MKVECEISLTDTEINAAARGVRARVTDMPALVKQIKREIETEEAREDGASYATVMLERVIERALERPDSGVRLLSDLELD